MAVDIDGQRDERILVASQWQLMRWKFRKHKMARLSSVIILVLYLVAATCEFVAPYDPELQESRMAYRPPTTVHFVDAEGKWHIRPFIYGTTSERDLESFSLVFSEDHSNLYPIYFITNGPSYRLWGLFESSTHLFGLSSNETRIFLLGADKQGRDLFSRIVYGSRLSLSIGLVGVLLTFVLGVIIGGISGFYGGLTDTILQRLIEFIRSIPDIPLWMALSAALPPNWPPVRVYFGITVILSLIGWTGLARVVRGRFLALREEDFVMAAKVSGSSELRIIIRHMVPAFASHIIASLTLAIPRMILSETSLSFLGLGLRYPAVSWGILLQEAQNVRSVAQAPWLLTPGLAVVLAVLSLNFLGDGLRDAADPYAR